ncbi:MAG: putative exported protein [Ignavibacteria bacterium]|nr:putative exported protein [Ignavibacteria bacterium]
MFKLLKSKTFLLIISGIFLFLLSTNKSQAHCDALDGPVITDARKALKTGDVKFVLKWVKKESEKEITTLFERTMKLRSLNEDTKEMADMYFFETLVRIHRAAEGAPYTGLKPAGTAKSHAIELTDGALDSGSSDELLTHLTEAIMTNVKMKYQRASEAQKKKDESIEAGRKFVEAYIDYMHFTVSLFKMLELNGHQNHNEKGKEEYRD